MVALGLLRIRVGRGINLAARDSRTSDPYVVVYCGSLSVKTRVDKNNCNPVWNEELTITVSDVDVPIILTVYDKDTFSKDDTMGDAPIDIKPYLECLKMEVQHHPDGTLLRTVQPNHHNCLAAPSSIIWKKSNITQDMILRLRNVECGEVEIQIEWLDIQPN